MLKAQMGKAIKILGKDKYLHDLGYENYAVKSIFLKVKI